MSNELYRFFQHHMTDRRNETDRRTDDVPYQPERREVERRNKPKNNKITIKTAPAKITCDQYELNDGLTITTTISVSKNK
jgi:hypothetical protein